MLTLNYLAFPVRLTVLLAAQEPANTSGASVMMDNWSNLTGSFRACIENVDLYRMQLEVWSLVGLVGPLSTWLSLLLTSGETGI